MQQKIAEKTKKLSSTTISYLESGEGNSAIIVFLHGFPENCWTWECYLTHFGRTYNVFAPDLPGYNFSCGFDNEEEYRVNHIVEVMAEFIREISNGCKVILVGHDWGGVIAWPLAAFYEGLFESLIILNSAHPSTFTREMLHNQRQQQASDYISDLISDNAYDFVSKDHFAMLKHLYARGFEHLSTNLQSRLLKQWADVKSMQNAFNYYRQMPLLHTKRKKAVAELKIPKIYINLKTLVLWGMRDTAFVPDVLNGLEEWVQQLKVVESTQDDHWFHHRNYQTVIAHIESFIADTSTVG